MLNSRIWQSPVVTLTAWVLSAAFLFVVISIPLDLYQQIYFGAFSFLIAWSISKTTAFNRLGLIAMIMLSVLASLRYMYWRLTSTVGFATLLDNMFGWGLVFAEIYALLVLLLGYVQTAWPLERKIVLMPSETNQWPTVDVFITTYNEPLSVVQLSVLAAQLLDWPKDKFNIFLLDDGHRPEFKHFCEKAGVNYLSRDNNIHAKAGNLNSALKQTNGEFVAMFDCDHVPTRSFLQVTMGWFLKDPKLAMLQTPHYFYSPDPFEKNLNTFRTVPNEGDLFYGLVQAGNDLWNASFFCGSCAVLRRDPLMEVGGIAIETVTEDAHTSSKLNRKGYNSAFLAIPQAAGLATESLSGHIKQRIRWARGMAQIFRIDNPLLGKGLSLGQRLCYLNAMLHFFYGLPRLVFLTAPLASLVFDAEVFHASAYMVAAFALPHIILSNLTNSKIQGQYRHSFWNEVYETVLAWYIMLPVLLALIRPSAGAFNVTDKGGIVENDFYDWRIGWPYIFLTSLNIAGFAYGSYRMSLDMADTSTLLINMVWCTYNIVIASACIFVAREIRQVRATPRVKASLPAIVTLENGKIIICETTDFSSNGMGLKLPDNLNLSSGEKLTVAISRGDIETILPGTVAKGGTSIGIKFDSLNIEQQRDLVQITFSRADTWAAIWGKGAVDSPLSSLGEVFTVGVLSVFRSIFKTKKKLIAIKKM
jgi:cellulose synthase (UDP-forming)